MSFKENLKIELSYKDMTVKELAFASGVNKRTIDQYLSSAAKMPSAENAVKIATVLGVSVEYLVTGKNSAQQTQATDKNPDQARLYKKIPLADSESGAIKQATNTSLGAFS